MVSHSLGTTLLSAALAMGTSFAARTTLAAAPTDEPYALSWVRGAGAEACPSEATMARLVAARLGRQPFSPDASRSMEGIVAREAGGWVMFLRIYEDGKVIGTRELTNGSPDCQAIAAASVLAMVIGIEPESAFQRPPKKTVEGTLSPLVSHHAPATTSFLSPASPAPYRGPWSVVGSPFPRMAASLRGVLGVGLLPQRSPGSAIAAFFFGRLWEGSMGMVWFPEASTVDQAFAFGLTAGWIGGCLNELHLGRVTLGTCVDVRLGAIHQVVVSLGDYAPKNPGDRAWAAVSPSQRLRIAVSSPLFVELGAELVVPLIRRDFAIEGWPLPVFSTPRLAFAGFFGVGVSIP